MVSVSGLCCFGTGDAACRVTAGLLAWCVACCSTGKFTTDFHLLSVAYMTFNNSAHCAEDTS
jgi:hypothetical protein